MEISKIEMDGFDVLEVVNEPNASVQAKNYDQWVEEFFSPLRRLCARPLYLWMV